jgi:hypothetical protein
MPRFSAFFRSQARNMRSLLHASAPDVHKKTPRFGVSQIFLTDWAGILLVMSITFDWYPYAFLRSALKINFLVV